MPLAPARPCSAEVGGSPQSSPSKAGSVAPLLRHQLSSGAGRNGLIKFPSGLSGVSSHENPMYDDLHLSLAEDGCWGGEGAGGTLQSVLPQHVGSWELQSQLLTQQAFAQAQQAAAAEAAAAAAQAEASAAQAAAAAEAAAEDAGWRPDVLAMLERKGATGRAVKSGRPWGVRGAQITLHMGQSLALGTEESLTCAFLIEASCHPLHTSAH